MLAPATAELTPRLTPRFHDVVSGDGTTIRAWTNGASGPTVLLCNGLGTNAWSWPALLDPDCGVRVISWNHRGVGGSARPVDRSRVGVDAFVEDAIAVLDDAGIEACPVIGWSIGVNTMFELAATHPERVTGLLAVAGVPGDTFASMLSPFHLPRPLGKALTVTGARVMRTLGRPISVLSTRLPIGSVTGQVLTHSGFMLPTPDLDNTRRTVREFLTTPVDWYMHLAVAASRHRRVPLDTITVPTAFVAGRWDLLASTADMRRAADRIPGARYVELPGSHFLTMERPDLVHQELLALIAQTPGG